MESQSKASIHNLDQEILKKDDLRVQTRCDRIHQHNDDQSSNSTKIFVGGLPEDLTVDEFRDYFQKFGSMEDVVVMTDKETGRPRGFGFVTFESPETAKKVLENRFHELKNKRVEVKKAVSKERMSRNFGNYYDTYHAVYNGTTFPFGASSSYGNFGGYYGNYGMVMMNGYEFGASYGCEGLSYIYYPYQSYNPSYYAHTYQNLCYYADIYSYQTPYCHSSKSSHKHRHRNPIVVKDGDDDSKVALKNTSLLQKFEDLDLGIDGEANGDGDDDGDCTEISEQLSSDCGGGGDGCAEVVDQDLGL
ncbi:hypothetical protein OSB04_000146 [Centaurea solstitialis]|uniref:RRM domain-containing protein n=1 Tax=Centaurea solstitialis TaxID=347529 RepID=A0AA38TNH4_9ASTR|nr:hypothetical protein OSB04_000146 [Centaurea solstitialis]